MRTKKGDMVRVCLSAWKGQQYPIARLSFHAYRVERVYRGGSIQIGPQGFLYRFKSWVRCAEMKTNETNKL